MNRRFNKNDVSNLVIRSKWSVASKGTWLFRFLYFTMSMSPLLLRFSVATILYTIVLFLMYAWYYVHNREEKESFELLKKISIKNNISKPIFIGKFLIDECKSIIYYYETENFLLYEFPIECIIKISIETTGGEVPIESLLMSVVDQGDNTLKLDCQHCNYKNVIRYFISMNPSLPVVTT